MRRIATWAVAVLLVAGAAGWLMPQRSRSEAWTAVQRGSFSNAWTSLRRHGLPGAWAALQRRASETWVAVRSHVPFGDGAKATASATLPSQRRGQPGTAKGTGKRGRNELSAVSSTP